MVNPFDALPSYVKESPKFSRFLELLNAYLVSGALQVSLFKEAFTSAGTLPRFVLDSLAAQLNVRVDIPFKNGQPDWNSYYKQLSLAYRAKAFSVQCQGRYIDFHTWNHNFNDFAGHASCLNLYTELLPYIDKLWIGEGFDYESKPDFWLVEMSGIPFGLMSEMLEADWQKVNPWKGLPFGMTTRLGWCEEADPTAIWQVFDKYRLEESEILGWWDEANAFISDTDGVLITEYRNENKRLTAYN